MKLERHHGKGLSCSVCNIPFYLLETSFPLQNRQCIQQGLGGGREWPRLCRANGDGRRGHALIQPGVRQPGSSRTGGAQRASAAKSLTTSFARTSRIGSMSATTSASRPSSSTRRSSVCRLGGSVKSNSIQVSCCRTRNPVAAGDRQISAAVFRRSRRSRRRLTLPATNHS